MLEEEFESLEEKSRQNPISIRTQTMISLYLSLRLYERRSIYLGFLMLFSLE